MDDERFLDHHFVHQYFPVPGCARGYATLGTVRSSARRHFAALIGCQSGLEQMNRSFLRTHGEEYRYFSARRPNTSLNRYLDFRFAHFRWKSNLSQLSMGLSAFYSTYDDDEQAADIDCDPHRKRQETCTSLRRAR